MNDGPSGGTGSPPRNDGHEGNGHPDESNPPARNDPLGPYYPSELPAVPGTVSKRAVLLVLGFWFGLSLLGLLFMYGF